MGLARFSSTNAKHLALTLINSSIEATGRAA
jgi:hypothetical protein